MTEPVSTRAQAPGKINLSLRSGGPGADGFHPLVTIFHSIDLTETVTVSPSAIPMLTLTHPNDEVPNDDRNLAWRAINAVRAALIAGDQTPNGHLSVEIRKEIPVAAGMAGGSADAAAALVAANAAWGSHLGAAELTALARTLGADVPFPLLGASAMGTGRGDQLVILADGGDWHWVVATQDFGLFTPEVFSVFDELGGRHRPVPEPGEHEKAIADALAVGDPHALAPLLHNDLTEAACELRPELDDTLAAIDRAGALGRVIAGSGPTVVALCLDAAHAQSVAEVVRQADVAKDVFTVRGPARGARVVRASH